MGDKFIFYEFDGEKYKVPVSEHKEFESKAPTAKMMLTYDGENYGVPLGELDYFVGKTGAENLTYSSFDDKKQYAPKLSVDKYMSFEEPEQVESTSGVQENTTTEVADVETSPVMTEEPKYPSYTYTPEKEFYSFEEGTITPQYASADELKFHNEKRRADKLFQDSVIASHNQNKSKIDDFLAAEDKKYEDKKSKEPEKSFWQKLSESAAHAQNEMIYGPAAYAVEEKIEDRKKGKDFTDAKIAKLIIDRTEDKVNEYLNPSKTFVSGAAQGIADAVLRVETWDAMVGADKAIRVYQITKKLDEGKDLTAGEQFIVDALVDDLASDMYLAPEFGRGYKAGVVTGESIPFMIETALNPASGLGKAVTEKFGKTILKKVTKKFVEKGIGRTATRIAAKTAAAGARVAADVAGAAIMSATTSAPRVAADALDRLSGQVDFNINEDGSLSFNGFVGGEDSFLFAYTKAFGANSIDHFSEMVGNYFGPLLGTAGRITKKGAVKAANFVGAKKIGSLIKEMKPNAFGSALGDFMEQTQWHGVLGEFSEEIVGGALNALIIGDQSLDKNSDKYIFEKDNLIDTFLGVSILGGAMSGLKTLGYTTTRTQLNRNIADAEKGLSKHLTNEEISELKAFSENPFGASYANLRKYFDDNKSNEYKESVGKYLEAVMKKQGYEISQQSDLSGTKQGLEEMEKAFKLGQNMTEADLYDVNEAESIARQALVDTGVFGANENANEGYLSWDVLNQSSYDLFKLSQDRTIYLSPEERTAIKNLAVVRNAKEGLDGKLNSIAQTAITVNEGIANSAANEGVITVGIYNGKKVYIKSSVNVSDGSIVAPSNVVGYPVEIVDSMTGEATTVDSKELSKVDNLDLEEYNKSIGDVINTFFQQQWDSWRNKKSAKAKLAEVEQFVGQKVFINTGNGGMAEVEVQQILPNGEVVVKGKKGDLGGQSTIRVDADSFYDAMSRDSEGNPIFNQDQFRSQTANINAALQNLYGKKEQAEVAPTIIPSEETPVVEQPEVKPQPKATVTSVEPVDYREEIVSILINGAPVNVEVINQDDASDTITYQYIDNNNKVKSESSTVAEFETAMKQAAEYNPDEPVSNAAKPVVNTEPAPVENDTLAPESINWDELFSRDADAFFAELQKQYGEKTERFLNRFISAAENELAKREKSKPESISDIIENEEKIDALQERIASLRDMLSRLTANAVEQAQEKPVNTNAGVVTINGVEVKAPEKPVVKRPRTISAMNDVDPQSVAELAARELGLKEGGIKLTKESFLHHTGYSGEAKRLKGLFLPKEKGGMTVEAAGDRLMEIDREYNLGLLDQNDPMAGVNAIIDAISANSTMGELRSYAARQRQAEAQREADAIYSYEMEQYEALIDEAVRQEVLRNELESGKALTEEEYNELNTIFAEEAYDYEQGTEQGEADSLFETEDIGDLPAAEGGASGGAEGSNQVLQETQPVQTRGEGNTEGSGVGNQVSGENASSPIYNGESRGTEGAYSAEVDSSLDEDMPDFESSETVLPNGYIEKDKRIINPTPIELPNSPEDASRIFLAEKDGKWGYQTYVKFDNETSYGSPNGPIQTDASHLWFDTKEEAIKAALEYFDYIRNHHGTYKGKPHGTAGIDAFVQHVKDNYLSESNTNEKAVAETPTVSSPIADTAKKIEDLEKELEKHLKKSLETGQPEDLAKAYGRRIGNLFATREEYEDYLPTAKDFGKYNDYVEAGIEESFANRPQYQIGNETISQTEATELSNAAVDMSLDGAKIEVVRPNAAAVNVALQLAGVDPNTMWSVGSNPIFVSNAAMAVAAIKMDKATPEQWLKMLEKNGLKAAEDKWMGLTDWLKASDKKTLTKQEVLDYIIENTIRIEEVHYSAKAEENAQNAKAEIENKLKEKFDNYVAELYETNDIEDVEWGAAHSYAIEKLREEMGDTNFPYTIENNGSDVWATFDYEDVDELQKWSDKLGISFTPENPIHPTRTNYTSDGLTNNKEIALVVPTVESYRGALPEVHFFDAGEGRAVVWVRFGDAEVIEETQESREAAEALEKLRKDAVEKYGKRRSDWPADVSHAYDMLLDQQLKSMQYKKVLVIDEVQSQRHQDGREKGYKDGTATAKYEKAVAEREKAWKEYEDSLRELAGKYGLFGQYVLDVYEVASKEEIYALNDLRDIYKAKKEIVASLEGNIESAYGGVPDAPFAKNWQELAMKRMLRYSAENGYDAVAWTSGKQQADRYSLTKHFSDIEREDDPSIAGRRFQLYGGNVETFIVDDSGVVTSSTIHGTKGKSLSEVVGKELAVKMMSIENGDNLIDEEIAVGGEGMKGFYDKMLPSFMNKYGKKWGVSVSDMTLPLVEAESGYTFHSIPVTEEMKQSVMEGQTMFFKTPSGTVYGWTDGKKIYLTKDGMNPNTKIHEYTHLWANAMMQKNQKGWNSIKDLLKKTPVWSEVMNDANYSDIHSNKDRVASEVLSRLSGRDNAAKLEQMAQKMIDDAKGTMRKAEARGLIQNIKDALQKFWNWVGVELFGIEKFESVEQITDRVLWDLVNQTNLGELSEGNVETQIEQNIIHVPDQTYSRIAQVLSDRYKGDDLYREFVDIDNIGYICDYIDRKPYVRAVNTRAIDENTRRDIRDAAKGRNDLTKDSTVAAIDLLRDKGRRQDWNTNDVRNEGAALGNDVVVKNESGEETTTKGNYEFPFGADWISVKTGEDGSVKPRVVFVEKSGKDDSNLYRKADAQNAAVDYLAGESRNEVIESAVNEEATKLGVKVSYKTREEMEKGHENDKGYYDTRTGEIVICTENNANIADAIQTILHEAIAHKGLRALIGDKFNQFINRVYNSLDAKTKAEVDALAAKEYDGNTAVAMEEYMAKLAESENFAEQTIWEKIKTFFNNIINSLLGRNDINIGDSELRYLLGASYNNMVNPNGMMTLEGWAKDLLMRENYGITEINTANPAILSRTGIDATKVATETAAYTYDNTVNNNWQEFQRQFQDAYQPVRIAIDAIQQETGNIPIEDYENYLLVQNHSSSRARVEIDNFRRKYYDPIVSQVVAIIDKLLKQRGLKNNEANRAEAYKEVRQYLIAKHGLERNKYYQDHRTRKLTSKEKAPLLKQAYGNHEYDVNLIYMDATLSEAERELKIAKAKEEYDGIVSEIESREVPDVRDYSGLTSLFGLESSDFEMAEDMAEDLIRDFETSLGRVDDENTNEMISQGELVEALWNKINAATDKTLRHSYESGLLSRQQYNDIKAMFNFYIPLRGFEETTAEDVYSYARFEGNRFNPAVVKTEGRTSIADDPLAIIMNMAESEIAQGNKNRAKQALYNYLLNRAGANNQQNSLMQVEDVWYIINVDENGNESYMIVAPDHEAGETYEAFENKMVALASKGKAAKSQKGKVDVGVRFQKQTNKNAHYVYLKINGVEKAIFINGDPKAADAINGTHQKKNGFVEEKMRSVNRFLSSTFTNYSLEFTARNYFRDLIYSHINIGIRESDSAYRKKFRQNWRHNNLGTMIKMLNAYRAGEFDGKPLTEDEAAFVEFMQNGGQTGYTVINSVETHKKDLEKAIERMRNGIKKGSLKDSTTFKYTLGAIELLNEASELVTRFAAFKTSRDMGRSVIKSISDAKEITVNFNTKGAQDGTGFLGGAAKYFGATKFFFNASVQGVQNIAAMAKANKLKFCGVVGGVAGLGFIMPIITSVISELLGGDDDEYWNIPEYERQNNICIVLGGGMYAKIPLPVGFREVYAIGDMVAAMLMDKKFKRDALQVGTDMANKIASVVLPINPLESTANGLSIWHTSMYTVLPSSLQFAVQNATNLDWKGAPLQKEYTYNENDPQWMKAFASNPEWLTGLSKWCNENINIDGDYKGLDFSPEKLDNTLSNLLGGVYSIVKTTGRGISAIWNEENRNLSSVPLARVIIGSGIEDNDRFIIDAYYDMKEYYDANVGYIERRAKSFGYKLDDVFNKKAGAHQPKMQEIYSNSNFDFMQEWYKGDKELNDMKRDLKNLETEMNKREKPSERQIELFTAKRNKYEKELNDFVLDMLEFD